MKHALELEVPDPVKLKVLFDELEFKTVAARILSEIDKSEKPREPQQIICSSDRFSTGISFRR